MINHAYTTDQSLIEYYCDYRCVYVQCIALRCSLSISLSIPLFPRLSHPVFPSPTTSFSFALKTVRNSSVLLPRLVRPRFIPASGCFSRDIADNIVALSPATGGDDGEFSSTTPRDQCAMTVL